VDHVQHRGAGILEPAGHRHRVVAVHDRVRRVAPQQPDAPPVAEVDRGDDDHEISFTNASYSASPASPERSGGNCVANTDAPATARPTASRPVFRSPRLQAPNAPTPGTIAASASAASAGSGVMSGSPPTRDTARLTLRRFPMP